MFSLSWFLPRFAGIALAAACSVGSLAESPLPSEVQTPAWDEDYFYFPHVRTVWREAIQWEHLGARAPVTIATLEEAVEEGNLPRAAFAYHSLVKQNYTPTDEAEKARFSELASQVSRSARRFLDEDEHQWGAHLLVERGLHSQAPNRPLALELLSQFGDDDIPFNATNGAEFYWLGIAFNPDSFIPPLIDQLIRSFDAGHDLQEQRILLNLSMIALLLHDENFQHRAYGWDLFNRGGLEWISDPHHFWNLSEHQRDRVLEIAVSVQNDWKWNHDNDVAHHGARRMARILVETTYPAARPHLYRALKNRELRHHDSLWFLGLMLADDPSTIFESPMDDALPLIIGDRQGVYVPSRIGSLFQRNAPSKEVFITRHRLFLHPPLARRLVDGWPASPEHHRMAVEAVRRAMLAESDVYAQLGLMLALNAMDCLDCDNEIGATSVSHFVDDVYYLNAQMSEYVLLEMGPRAIPFALAGVGVGVQKSDWQMVALSANVLRYVDPAFDPGDFPEANDFLWIQLADDDIPGNATAAMRYFMNWRDGGEEYVRARERGDAQQEHYRERILAHFADQP